MFGPVRGPWPDEQWKGWWGDSPPYHCDVFVLTHHPRKSFEMEGGTVFHFVTDGIHSALDKAKASAKGKDVRIGGGAAAIRQYLRADLIDDDVAFIPRAGDRRARSLEGSPGRPPRGQAVLDELVVLRSALESCHFGFGIGDRMPRDRKSCNRLRLVDEK